MNYTIPQIADFIAVQGVQGPDAESILAEGQTILESILDSKLVIAAEVAEITKLLLQKNRAYGSSVFKPMGIFVKTVDPLLTINARIEDKLARIKQATDFSEDTELDLIGYLILKRLVDREMKRRAALKQQPELPAYRVGELHPSAVTDNDGYDSER